MEMIHYGVTKGMYLALSRGLAETTVETGVTVNAVLPGPTRSDGVGRITANRQGRKLVLSLRRPEDSALKPETIGDFPWAQRSQKPFFDCGG
jgi:NAD(P)-dependent dehydrogenase (short-subunit alcohol dehydrogenase family)